MPFKRRFPKLDPTMTTVPALIDGHITGPGSDGPGTPLAISLGGRIEAVTQTFGRLGRFNAMLSESALARWPRLRRASDPAACSR